MIQRLTNQLYLCLDRDAAGKQALIRSIENLQNEPVDIYVINIAPSKDPDEFLKNGGDFSQAVSSSQTAVMFLIDE